MMIPQAFLCVLFALLPMDIGEDLKAVPKVQKVLGAKFSVTESYIRRSIISTRTPYGFKISQVDPNSPAARAGWKKGDILLEWGERPVESVAELAGWIEEESPGSIKRFLIARRRIDVTLLSRRPWKQVEGKIRLMGAVDSIWDRLRREKEADAQVREMVGADLGVARSYFLRSLISSRDVYGFKIAKVNPESPAARAGWKRGDILLTWDGKPIKRVTELAKWIRSEEPGSKVPFRIARRVGIPILSRDPWEEVKGELELD